MSANTESKITPEQRLTELSEFLVASLLPENADFMVKLVERRGVLQVVIQTPEQFRGAIIGKSGMIAKSLRQIMSSVALDDPRYKVDVEIAD